VQLRLLPSEDSFLLRLPRPLWTVPLQFPHAGLLDLLAGQLRQLASSAFAPQLAAVNSNQLQLSAGDARVVDWSTVAAMARVRAADWEPIELRYALSKTAATGIAQLEQHANLQHAVAPARTARHAPPPTAASPPAPAPPPLAPAPPPPSRAELARAQRILEGQRRAAAAQARGQANRARDADALRNVANLFAIEAQRDLRAADQAHQAHPLPVGRAAGQRARALLRPGVSLRCNGQRCSSCR